MQPNMTEQPIFELFHDEEKSSSYEYVKIFVPFNGERKSLLEATEILEKRLFDTIPDYRCYDWEPAHFLYESLLDAREKRAKFASVLSSGTRTFFVTVNETEDQIIWSRMMRSRPLQEGETDIFDGIHYPDFVFDKKHYDEEMEKLRVIFEREKKIEDEHNRTYRIACVRDYFWDKETLHNDTIDYSSLARPQPLGPIFEAFDSGYNYIMCDCVKIFVQLDRQRRLLIEVLKEWEASFDTERETQSGVEISLAGSYTWLPLPCIYEDLLLKARRQPFFRDVLTCGACGLPGPCWPFRVQVRETDDLVIWTNYRQPHRNKYSLGGYWDYSQYPPLVFDKQQYYAELETMRPAYEQYLAKRAEMEPKEQESENSDGPWL